MDFSIRSLRTLKAEASSGSKARTGVVRDFQNSDRMSVVVKGVRDVLQQSNVSSMKVNDIVKAIGKNRMSSVGQIDRDELLAVLTHYKKLQIIYIDDDENVLFL